jgi:hypothetical protein
MHLDIRVALKLGKGKYAKFLQIGEDGQTAVDVLMRRGALLMFII